MKPAAARRGVTPRTLAWLLLLSATYFLAARVGLALAVVHPSASAVWPPAGISLAAFLLYGPRVWPAIALGAFLANLTTSGSVGASALIAVGNTLEGFVGGYLLRRFADGPRVLATPSGIFQFLTLGGAVAPLISATIGVTGLLIGGLASPANLREIWTTWWFGDAMGILVVAPAILCWATGGPLRRPRQVLEALAAALLFAVTAFAFFGGIGVERAPVTWLWIPAIVWVAHRFGQRAAATTILVLSALTVWGTIRGLGPFALPSPNASLVLLQGFLGVLSVTALTLSAVVAMRERTMNDLRRSRDELEERVRRRTTALAQANESLHAEIVERLQLQRELVAAGEAERNRLGRDLHDDLGQLLTGISFLSSVTERKLSAHSNPEADSVREIRHLVQAAISKTRLLSRGLTPISLGTGGLRAAVLELASMTERVFGVTCAVQYDEHIFVDRPIAATNVYRILQEAISNAVRHSQGTRVDIVVTLEGRVLTMTVSDDGSGLATGGTDRRGLGLGTMTHRAEILGGTLHVESTASGTTVRCVLPDIAHRGTTAPPVPE